ncbi:MAG: dihydroneopterin aldolase [Cyclobacteriaceae bacterium]|nr:dihydroneopterin aldolase [Cyclobacteriaceae bacterium]
MKLKGKVVLEGLAFHAYHGIYPEERTSGNKFEVDIVVNTSFEESVLVNNLLGTINYEEIYLIVKNEMEKPSKLLEPVAHSIAQGILDSFSTAIKVEVTISKFNPPIGGICRKAKVSIDLQRDSNL